MSNKQEILYGLCLVAIALQTSAICTDHWSVCSSPKCLASAGVQSQAGTNSDISMGLWKACGETSQKPISMDLCQHLPLEGVKSFPKNSLYTARAFAVMGVIFVFLSLSCMMYVKNNKRCQLACLLVGGLSSLVAMVVWAAELLKVKLDDNSPVVKFRPGYSFYLNLSGGVVALLAAAYYNYAS